MDDQQALSAYVRDGDAAAVQFVLQRYQGLVHGACRRLLGDASLADDAAQETFAKLLHHAPRLAAGTGLQLGGWLYRTATTTALNLARGERARAARERAWAERTQALVTARPAELLEHLDEALARLPADQQDLVVAYHLRDRSQMEIAVELGISQPAVNKRLAKAMDALRRELRRGGLAVGLTLLGATLREAAAHQAPSGLALQLSKLGALSTALGGIGGGGGLVWLGSFVALLLAGLLLVIFWPPPEVPVTLLATDSAADQRRGSGAQAPTSRPVLRQTRSRSASQTRASPPGDPRFAGGGLPQPGKEVLVVDFTDADYQQQLDHCLAQVERRAGLTVDAVPDELQRALWEQRSGVGLLQRAGRSELGSGHSGGVPGLLRTSLFRGPAYRCEVELTVRGRGTYVNLFCLAIDAWTPWVSHWENEEVSHRLESGRRHTVVVDLVRETWRGESVWDLSYRLDEVPMHRGRYHTDTADLLLYNRGLHVTWHRLVVRELVLPEGGLPPPLAPRHAPVRDPARGVPIDAEAKGAGAGQEDAF